MVFTSSATINIHKKPVHDLTAMNLETHRHSISGQAPNVPGHMTRDPSLALSAPQARVSIHSDTGRMV
jgi:hypothetical protein